MPEKSRIYSVYLRPQYQLEHIQRLLRNFAHSLDDQQGAGQLLVIYCAWIDLKHPHLAEVVLNPQTDILPPGGWPATTIWIPYQMILLITDAEGPPASFEHAAPATEPI